MLRKVMSLLTHRCPKCRFREGARVKQRRERFLNFFLVHLFHCNSCNIDFHAISLR